MDKIKWSADLDVSKRTTNHSVQKPLDKKLKKADTEIIAITGHKSEDHHDEVIIYKYKKQLQKIGKEVGMEYEKVHKQG